jgi:hypothetical protein
MRSTSIFAAVKHIPGLVRLNHKYQRSEYRLNGIGVLLGTMGDAVHHSLASLRELGCLEFILEDIDRRRN